MYIYIMYASEKYVRAEVKQLKESIHSVANDLGSDLVTLHDMIIQLRERVEQLETQIKGIDNE